MDLQALKTHELTCSHMRDETLLQSESDVVEENMASLKIDNSELEANFSQDIGKIGLRCQREGTRSEHHSEVFIRINDC